MYEDIDGDGFGSSIIAGCGSYNNADCNTNSVTYADSDGDNFGDQNTLVPCGVIDLSDCDDSDDQVNPGMAEIPGNSLDDNCDGFTDEIASLEESAEFEFVLFPNPTKGEVHIIFKSNEYNIHVEIYAMNGKLMTSTYQPDSGLLELTTDNFVPGLYFIKITADANTGVARLVVE
ncbi:MAG: T9SS type A sorting domain-containing protein [Crocinitomicaceae bacterium]|nr:T9SS type A sorting domain-containing protein [Crocinitomicaceae bacterium]